MGTLLRTDGAQPDGWVHLRDELGAPDAGDVTFTLDRWLAEYNMLRNRSGRNGVRLQPGDDARLLAEHVGALALIACEFPRFADGRGYSQARVLRDQLGYTGELRAVGEILRDQAFYLRRCGFDVLVVPEGRDVDGVAAGLRDFSVTYQAAADGRQPVYRHATHAVATNAVAAE